MSVTLKLSRGGLRKNAFYRVLASVKGSKRDGKYIEIVGTYNPMVSPALINLDEDKVRKWLTNGAQTTGVVRDLIIKKIPGFIEGLEKKRLEGVQASRRSRKERTKARQAKA